MPTADLLGPDGRPLTGHQIRPREDGFDLPHVLTFASILSSGWRAYFQDKWDEALKHSREDALAMRRDGNLMGMLQERRLAVAKLPWHLEVNQENHPAHKAVRDGVTEIIRAVPRLRTMLYYLADATWYGKYASHIRYEWRVQNLPDPLYGGQLTPRRSLCVFAHRPVLGDKLGHTFDGTPFVSVYSGVGEDELPGATFIWTSLGRAMLLVGSWRERFVIHHHYDVDDSDYFEEEAAEALHGVGLRSRLFWVDWLRKEWLAKVSDWIDKVGLGVNLWYYQGGNDKSREETRTAARKFSDKLNLLIPRWDSGKGQREPTFERLETPVAGAEVLIKLLEHLEKVEERLVVGQQASSRSETSGLGTHDTESQQETKAAITQMDAEGLAETLTGSHHAPGVVNTIQRWSYPGTEADIKLAWKFGVEKPESKDRLEAGKIIVEMGVPVRADELRAAAGFSKPNPGDEIVEMSITSPLGGGDSDPFGPETGGQNGNGQSQSSEPFSEGGNGAPRPRFSDQSLHYDRCRWVTIGADAGEDGKKRGGTPICIDGKGNILKGPQSLAGRQISKKGEVSKDLSDKAVGTHRQQLHRSREHARASIRRQARKKGINTEDLDSLANDILRQHTEHANDQARLLTAARKFDKSSSLDILRANARRGNYDAARVKGLDEIGENLAKSDEWSGHFRHDRAAPDYGDQLFEMLTAAPVEELSEEDAFWQALEELESRQADTETGRQGEDEVPFSRWDSPLTYELFGGERKATQGRLFDESKHPRDPEGKFTDKGDDPAEKQFARQQQQHKPEGKKKPRTPPRGQLQGTETQVKWAERIRKKHLKEAAEIAARMGERHPRREEFDATVQALEDSFDAGYWIDHGKKSFRDLYLETRKRLDEGKELARDWEKYADF